MDKLLLLKRIPLFSSLKISEIRALSESVSERKFRANEIILEEGQKSEDLFYLVGEGQLEVILNKEPIKSLHAGNYFGEVSLLSGEPHSATIRARTSGTLYIITKNVFDKVIERHPEILRWLSKVIGKELHYSLQLSHKERGNQKIYIILSAEKQVGKSVLALDLAASLLQQTGKKVILLDFYAGEKSSSSWLKITGSQKINHHASGLDLMAYFEEGEEIVFDREKINQLFNQLRENYGAVIVDVPAKLFLSQYKILVEEADEVLFLSGVSGDSWKRTNSFISCLKNNIDDLTQKLWVGVIQNKPFKVDRLPGLCRFVLPFDAKAVTILQERGLPIEDEQLPFHMAVSRLAREIGNLKIGLALSAGMAHGLAHIGVLKVLQREKIPIDVVAGTSGGALYSIPFVAGVPMGEIEKEVVKISRFQIFSLLDITLPFSGFIRGNKIINFIKRFIGDVRFDELSVPLKVIATDFESGEMRVLDQGSVLQALRASISVPGIFTLVKYNGRYMVDGATSSPVPVDVLYRFGVEKTIAVNTCVDPACYHEKIDAIRKEKGMPHLFDIITQSRAITTHHIAEIETHKADIAIVPSVSDFSWHDYHRAKELIAAGEKAAEEALPKIRELLKL